MMTQYADGGKHEIDILTRLANCVRLVGDLQKATEYLEHAMRICHARPELMQAYGGSLLNTIGWVNRLQGKWDKAAEYYRQSIDLLTESGDYARLAEAYNNLGYIIGLQSNYDGALRYCRQALKMQVEAGLKFASGATLNTLGIIYRSEGEFQLALDHINQAVAVFEEFEDQEWLAKAYCERGATRWYMRELQAAELDLEKSYQTYKLTGLTLGLANILHRKAHVAWDLGDLQNAEYFFRESANIGRQVSDIQQTVNSLEGLVELYYFIGQVSHAEGDAARRDEWYAKAKQVAAEWQTAYEDRGYYFPLYSGSRLRILGNIAYDLEDYETALQFYLKAYPRIATRGGYSIYSLPDALDRLQKRIHQLTPARALEWCQRIQVYWEDMALDKAFPEMISMCEIERDAAKHRLTRPEGGTDA